jgi:hypothetical protein
VCGEGNKNAYVKYISRKEIIQRVIRNGCNSGFMLIMLLTSKEIKLRKA